MKAVKCEVSNLVLLTSFLVETGEWWACDIVSYKRCSRPSHLHQWSDSHSTSRSPKTLAGQKMSSLLVVHVGASLLYSSFCATLQI
ncbi:hypothetical protein BC629DRAFT_1563447 [Irpex lacteus]|nr:hypothetical protein BC629DRAFT_1563447 [Irpex lacteus]